MSEDIFVDLTENDPETEPNHGSLTTNLVGDRGSNKRLSYIGNVNPNRNKVLNKLLSMDVSELTSGQMKLLNMFLTPKNVVNKPNKLEVKTVPAEPLEEDNESDDSSVSSSSSSPLSSSSEDENDDRNEAVTNRNESKPIVYIAPIRNIPPIRNPEKVKIVPKKHEIIEDVEHDHYYTESNGTDIITKKRYDKLLKQVEMLRKKLKASQAKKKSLEQQVRRLKATIQEQNKLLLLL